jgi:hypothetical protein
MKIDKETLREIIEKVFNKNDIDIGNKLSKVIKEIYGELQKVENS